VGVESLMLSSGDTTGFGWHADFIAGWNEALLQRAINQGRPACAAFTPDACDALRSPAPDEWATVRSGPAISQRPFCTPVAPFPDGEGLEGSGVKVRGARVQRERLTDVACTRCSPAAGNQDTAVRAHARDD